MSGRDFAAAACMALAILMPLQAQDAPAASCGSPPGGTTHVLPPEASGQEPSLWSLVLRDSSWTFDPVKGTALVRASVHNEGAERIRGPGIQVNVYNGAGAVIGSAWTVAKATYIEPGSTLKLRLELALPKGLAPASVRIDTVMVMGSCGW
jgi:hypothetical protein